MKYKMKNNPSSKLATGDSVGFKIFILILGLCMTAIGIGSAIDYFNSDEQMIFTSRYGVIPKSSITVLFFIGGIVLISGFFIGVFKKK